MTIRKILVLGDESFMHSALERWFDTLERGTILLPLMRGGPTVTRLRQLARQADISVMLSMSADEKIELATEVVVLGEMEFNAQERAMAYGLPWTVIVYGGDEPTVEQPTLFE